MKATRDTALAVIWFLLIMAGFGFTGGLEMKWAAEDAAMTSIVQAGVGR